MGMPESTFKNKLNDSQTAYKFTDAEYDRLLDVLRELATDIETVSGLTFNQTLAQLAGN
jgi:hypothetical protein